MNIPVVNIEVGKVYDFLDYRGFLIKGFEIRHYAYCKNKKIKYVGFFNYGDLVRSAFVSNDGEVFSRSGDEHPCGILVESLGGERNED